MQEYDVVIIGAGPAGLMAARELQDKVNLLVIDPKKKIGLPLRCGEGIREKEFLEFFKTKDFDFVKNTANAHEVVYKNLKRTFYTNFLELDRPKFEQWLAKPISNIKLNTTCLDVKINKENAVVITNKENYSTKLVIISCGSSFFLQKNLGLINQKQDLVVGYGGIYKNHNLDPNKFYYYFHDDCLGYFWVFPKNKDIANIGFGAFNNQKNVKQIFYRLLKEFNFERLKLVKPYSGIVTCSGPIKKTYANRVIVTGSAAGFVYAGTGEGIYFALLSGRIAANTVLKCFAKNRFDKDFLKIYEAAWKKRFGIAMKSGLIFGHLLGLGYKYNKYNKLFRVPTEKELRGMILGGELPARAKIAYRLGKVLGLFNKNIKKERVPLRLRLIYRVVRLFV